MKTLAALAPYLLVTVSAGSASALPVGVNFDISINEGPDTLTSLGTVRFAFSAQVVGQTPGAACRYGMSWARSDATPEATCTVDELRWLGQQSCMLNAGTSIPSFLLRAPSATCRGFDSNGLSSDVFQLVLAERADASDLMGLIMYTPASPSLYGLRLARTPL